MYPLYLLFISYSIGIIIGNSFKKALFFPWLFLLLTFISLGNYIILKVIDVRGHRLPVLALCLSFFLCLGFSLMRCNINPIDDLPSHHLTNFFTQHPTLTNTPIILIGKIINHPEYFPQKLRLYLKAEKIILSGKKIMTSGLVQLDWYKPTVNCRLYDQVQVIAKLRFPQDYRNPAGFSYSHYLLQKGITITGHIKDLSLIPAKMIPYHLDILRKVDHIKRILIKYIQKAVPNQKSTLLKAILLGEKQSVPKAIKDLFSEAGIAHLLSISGLHLGILTFTIFSTLKLFIFFMPDHLFELITCLVKPSKIIIFLSIPLLIFYTIITGYKISTVRSLIMIMAYSLAFITERDKNLWTPIIVAAFFILLFQPEALFSSDFQLTFIAALSIILLIKIRQDLPSLTVATYPNSLIYKGKEYISNSLQLSSIVFLLTSPLVVYYFHIFSPIGIITNLLAIPLLTLVLCLGLAAIFSLIIWPGLALFLFHIAAKVSHLLVQLGETITKIPYTFFYLPSPSKAQLLIFYVGILFLLFLIFSINQQRLCRRYLIPLIIFPISIIILSIRLFSLSPHPISNKMEVTFLDVGRGDACLIRTADGKIILIDGGGSYDNEFDFGKNVLAPFLWHQRIHKLDLIILSHPHPDHLHGLLFILKHFIVSQVLKTKEVSPAFGYLLFENIIKGKKIPTRCVARGDRFQFKNLSLEVLAPEADLPPLSSVKQSHREENNRSLVFKLIFHQVTILFTGDIESRAEENLLNSGDNLHSTIIKVPHHGSRYSSTPDFLRQVSPRVAIFSGRDYGNQKFPHPFTLSRYNNLGCTIYRTDLDGAITLKTDGLTFTVITQSQVISQPQQQFSFWPTSMPYIVYLNEKNITYCGKKRQN